MASEIKDLTKNKRTKKNIQNRESYDQENRVAVPTGVFKFSFNQNWSPSQERSH